MFVNSSIRREGVLLCVSLFCIALNKKGFLCFIFASDVVLCDLGASSESVEMVSSQL